MSSNHQVTLFYPKLNFHRKNWIGFSTITSGVLLVNEGAKTALLGKKQRLLPIGSQHKGELKLGMWWSIQDDTGTEVLEDLQVLVAQC